jgi:hypothetical protein
MPANDAANILALRAHALALPAVARTTGVDLAATATGYVRSDGGSFLTDGFMAGMEVVPTGFTETLPGIVTSLSATSLTIAGGRDVEAAAPGRTLSVALPSLQAWENDIFPAEGTDLSNRWYVDEDYLPGPSVVRTTGPGRRVDTQPAYVLTLYGPPNFGVLAHFTLADALLNHFAPHTALFPSSGDVLRVRGDVAPYRGQLTVREGFALITVTLPLWLRTVNSI